MELNTKDSHLVTEAVAVGHFGSSITDDIVDAKISDTDNDGHLSGLCFAISGEFSTVNLNHVK